MLVLRAFLAILEGTHFWGAGLGKLVLRMPLELIWPRSIHKKHENFLLQVLEMLLKNLLPLLLPLANLFINQFFPLLPLLIDFLDLNILLKYRVLPELMLQLLSEFIFFVHGWFHFSGESFDFGSFSLDHFGTLVDVAVEKAFFLQVENFLLVEGLFLSDSLVHH